MSRPVDNDESYSPVDVVFMGWVGDEDASYSGLSTAIRYMLESGSQGYVGFGSDIGGYRTNPNAGPLGRTKEVFLRWAAVGAFSSFMENGGTGEHLPWNFDSETTDVYRSWVNLHYQLVPYLYSEGTKVAIGKNGTLMRPCSDLEGKYLQSYFLGPKFYVVPVLRDPTPGRRHLVWLPRSSTQQWIDYFNTTLIYKAHKYIEQDTNRLDRLPVYVEQNSLIPMYDLEKSPSLNAYKFVFYGKAIIDKQTATLFTRDGQRWLIEFDRLKQKLTVHFIEQYDTNKKEEWIWKFCQNVNGQEICSQDWFELSHQASYNIKALV
jgi:alpha-glucosidase (family GH31 glycosyl hydrolase)